MKKSFILLLILGFSIVGNAQENENLVKKIAKKVFSAQGDSTRSASFMALPALAYAQETGFEFGIASNYNFYLDKKDPQSRTSSVMLIGTLTTKNQKKININTDIWTKNNDYHILGELRLRDWPFNFYGIGNDTWQKDENNLDQKLYRVKLDVEKKVISNLYVGINANYDNFSFKDLLGDGIFEQSNLTGKNGGQFLALGFSTLYDTRNVTTYTTAGMYARVKWAYAPRIFKADDFKGSLTEVDVKGFIPFNRKVTLAAQGIYRGTQGKNIPFYVMRDLGGDMIMRGYYLGRYKDNNYIASQAELRYRLHPRFGVSGFVGTGSTFSDNHKIRMVPSYGGGLRYFFSIEHSSSIRIDYAIGEQRPGEKRQSGFYLSVSEAF
ncbi:polymerase [Sphingobacterium sp. Mn56C]|uniref:polymerase n=1 Tax=Sphingobacterium sp. Mn56C TaxID=3395261 RepID=UPI003BC7C566